MTSSHARVRTAVDAVALFALGGATGWLLGMSTSPVLHLVIASFFGLVCAVAGVSAGLNGADIPPEISVIDKTRRARIWPLSLVALGILVGSIVGIWTRTNEVLGPNISIVKQHWRAAEFSDRELARMLFDYVHSHASEPQKRTSDTAPNAGTGGLFAVTIDDCSLAAGHHKSELRTRLETSNNPAISAAAKAAKNDDELEGIVTLICALAKRD